MLNTLKLNNESEGHSVCFLNYDLGFGGTEKVIVSLANHFCLNGKNVTILTLASRNDFTEFIHPDIKLVCLHISKMKFVLPKLISFVFKNKFDNFIANVWPLTFLSFVIRLFSRKTKLIFIEHCNLSEQFKNRSKLFKLLQNISISFFYKFSHLIIGVSQGVKDDLVKKGINETKIKVIYNPIIAKPIQEVDSFNKLITGWKNSSKKKLIAVGEFKAQKNFLNLVEAVYFAKKNLNFDPHLLILGDGEERLKVSQRIINLGLEENIFLTGWVNDPLPYFDIADLFILSSDYEGFGVVIAEAMSRGLNIVSTDCKSGPSEILEDGRLGYLCEVNNPESLAKTIINALNNPINPDELVKRSKDFSEKVIGRQYEEILN